MRERRACQCQDPGGWVPNQPCMAYTSLPLPSSRRASSSTDFAVASPFSWIDLVYVPARLLHPPLEAAAVDVSINGQTAIRLSLLDR